MLGVLIQAIRTSSFCLRSCPRRVLHHPKLSVLYASRTGQKFTGHRLSFIRSNVSSTVKGRGHTWSSYYASKMNFWIKDNRKTTLLLFGCGLLGSYLSILMSRHSQCVSPVIPVATDPQITYTKEFSEVFTNELSLFQKLKLSVRFIFLCLVFSPILILHPASYLTGSTFLEKMEVRYLIFVLQTAGPAFIKLGQWASTRRDLFSENFCQTLSSLHTHCIPHTWAETQESLVQSFGEGWNKHLLIQDHNPIGCGCVAQVYQGYLKRSQEEIESGSYPSEEGVPSGVPIAVKVMHAGMVEAMDIDIHLMRGVASWIDYLYPDVHWIALKECVDEFAVTMQKQLDMEMEAHNLSKFSMLMKGYDTVKFPTPLYPFVTKSVLVESYERGDHISEYLGEPGGHLQKRLAKIGIDVLLDMMFIHNFVHGDLHPGNILVQDPSSHPKLVFIDCGIATSLGSVDFENFHKMFKAIVTGHGDTVADLMLNGQTCQTLKEYRQDMAELVDEHLLSHLKLTEIQVSTLFSRLFNILIDHKVRISPNYTTVMVALMVVEGVARSLDPGIDILDNAKLCILQRAKLVFQDKLKQTSDKFFF